MKNLLEDLQEWNISPELFDSAQAADERQVAESAKKLIVEVNHCISDQTSANYNFILAGMVDLMLRQGNSADDLFTFMEKYVKAASVLSSEEIHDENDKYLKYAFDVDENTLQTIPDRLHTSRAVLREKRDAFVCAAVAWRERQEKESEGRFTDVPERETEYEAADKPKSVLTTESKRETECGASSEPVLFATENRTALAQSECKTAQGTVLEQDASEPEVSGKLADSADSTEDLDIYDQYFGFLDGEPDSSEPYKKDVDVWDQEEVSVQEIYGSKVISGDTVASSDEEPVASKPKYPAKPGKMSVIETDQIPERKPESEMAVPSARKKTGKNTERGLQDKESVPNSLCQKCAEELLRWLEMAQNGELQAQTDFSDIEKICWALLSGGQFAVARELAATFESLCQCVNTAVIDLVGSGLYLPITDRDTQVQFLLYQPLIQIEQLRKEEYTAVVLASIPVAHCSRDVKFDNEMIQELPECCRIWSSKLIKRRKRVTYMDIAAIENHRIYRVRLKKIRAVLEKARKQFESMYNTNLSYEAANKVMVSVCDKDQCIGKLQNIMECISPEIQVYGVENSKVRKLYDDARVLIPARKNDVKDIDERLINNIIKSGQKKYGYKTEIVGDSKKQMMQFIRGYLRIACEWMELIQEPCHYTEYDQTSQFMAEATEIYLVNRPQIYQYAMALPEEKILKNVYRQMIAVMDYLTGEEEKLPDSCKTYIRHAYRLCSVPSLAIRKNESGIYHYSCEKPVERLQFLVNVMQHDLKPVERCIDDFIEAEDYSGCDILFDLLEPEEYERVTGHYREKVEAHLEELKATVYQMKNSLYPVSVFSGWLGADYRETYSKITQIECMLNFPEDFSLLCHMVKECRERVENLVERFCAILRDQVNRELPVQRAEEWNKKLHGMIDEGHYSAVIEWMAHANTDIMDADMKREDFFRDRYFIPFVYSQKEKGLLDSNMRLRELTEKLQNTVRKTHAWGGFNFNRVPGSLGSDRARLLGLWYKIKANLQNSKNGSIQENDIIYDYIKEMLGLLGWSGVRLEQRIFCEDESGGHIQFDMYFTIAYSRDKCPIPLFGSNSNGRIRMLCLYGSTHAPDKLYHLFESDNEQMPVIILFFGVMTRKRRMELYSLILEKQSSFLVVDDIVVSTICERRESLLLRWLYALTVPFSVQTMYTSSLGVVPPEMFYGRVTVKRELGITGTVCAVYGGRQLGKTALLKNIEYESHQPKDDYFVYYIKLPTRLVEDPDYCLTKTVGNKVRKDIIDLDNTYLNMESLLEDIGNWLLEKKTRRLLLLLDEADQFLLEDSKNGFAVTGHINGLMTSTNLRFKVVFAGLHNVYRMISSPNHPLAHHGKPISIGPLLDEELQDAINLILQPFEIMGYRFDSLDLIIRILAETNYYPSLIQLFCMKLHEYLLLPGVRKDRCENLPITIYMSDIDMVLNNSELKKSISDRFMWTLELDDRYKAIVLSIALDAGEAVKANPLNDIVKGYDLHWISSKVKEWPELFGDYTSLDNIRGLCDELVQLGILCSVSSDRYTLRTINILNMLGTQESILNKLCELEGKKYDAAVMYNGMLYRNIFSRGEFAGYCYPLTNQQVHSIFDIGGVKFLAGSNALGLDLVEPCLRELLAVDMENPSFYDLYQQKRYKLCSWHNHLPAMEELGDHLTVNIIFPECQWSIDTIKVYAQRLNDTAEQDRPILLVLCDEIRCHLMQVETQADIDFIPIIRLTTWDPEAVRLWLNESVLAPLLENDIMNIVKCLCGWPVAMYKFREMLTAQNREVSFVEDILKQTVESLAREQMLSKLLPDQETEPLLQPILEIYSEYQGSINCEEMQLLLSDAGIDAERKQLEKVMAWMADCRLLNRQMTVAQKENNSNDTETYCMDALLLKLWETQLYSL